MTALPQFDELYCISDLHLGGRDGFQVFREGELLAAFFGHITALDPAKRVVLIVNGDFIDYLAEAQGRRTYLDTAGAAGTLERVFDEPAFAPALAALGSYVRTDNRFLAVTLGNHDLELALPEASEALLGLLARNDPAALGRIHLAFDGTGFGALVGGGKSPARVLAVHGNEADPFNVTDHEALRQAARDLRRGRIPPVWKPNAGTKLVVDLMNDIKAEHPFIDLVKPEFAAAVPILVALRPALLGRVKDLLPSVGSLIRTRVRSGFGLLAEDSAPSGPGTPASAPPVPGTLRRTFIQAQVSDLLEAADRRLAEGVDPVALAGSRQEDLLGVWGLIADLALDRDPAENLRQSLLRWLAHTPSGALGEEDGVFAELGREAGPAVDVVLTGHTHKPRAIRRRNGGLYYNSGSWIDRIELNRADLAPGRFEQVYGALAGRQALTDVPGLILRRPVVVHLAPTGKGGRVLGRLCTVSLNGGVELEEIKDSVMEVQG